MKEIKKIYTKYEEIINYLIFGVLTTMVSLSTYYIYTFTFLDANNPLELQIANIISWVCAVLFAYITNRKFVFKSKSNRVHNEMFSFFSSRVLTLLFDMFLMFLFVSLMNTNDKISKLIVQVVVTIGNYILSKFLVFKKKEF